MKTATLQSLLALNSMMITALEATVKDLYDSARGMKAKGEIAYAIEDYKLASFYRKKLAIRVASQKELKAAITENNTKARIKAKVVRMFGKEVHDGAFAPRITSVEIEAALDELLAIKFPKKADTRPANHKSFQKTKKAA